MLNKQQFIEQLEKLVAFQTVTGNVQENTSALDYIQTLIDKSAHVSRYQNGNAEILIASNQKTNTPDFGYLVHLDVVAGNSDQYKITQKDNLVYGRGVSDMKFSIPIGIALLNESLNKEAASFALAITTDEEVGGQEGANYLANQLNFRPKVLIVPDGGDNMNIVNKSKGIAQFKVSIKGKAAHGSRPWLGKNAIVPLTKLIVALEEKYGKNSLEENWNTTLNFGKIEGGEATNKVCDYAYVQLDFRFPETASYQKIKNDLAAVALTIDDSFIIEYLGSGNPTFVDENSELVKRYQKIMSKHLETDLLIKPTYGGSDADHFSKYNIPYLMSKPKSGGIHSAEEWLNVDSTMKFYQGLREYIFNLKR